MKAKIEPKRFKNILEAIMVSGEIEPFSIKSTEKGLTSINVTESSILASIVVANREYFLEFEPAENEEITFGKEVVERLRWGFKKDDLIINADEEKMLITDGTDKLPVELDEKIDRAFPIPITSTQYGLLPDYNKYKAEDDKDWDEEKTLANYNIYKTDAANLDFPGSVTNYKLNLKDGNIFVSIDGVSTSFEHKVEGELIEGSDTSIIVSADLFKKIVSNLEGEVVLVFDDSSITLLQKEENLCKTFCLATKEED